MSTAGFATHRVPMLTIDRLSKTYPSGVQALRQVSLDVPSGIFGLLGPNGAGKSTLMKILATLLEADSGAAHMNGVDLLGDKQRTRRMLGYLPQDFGLYPTLTAEQMLDYFASLKGVEDRAERRTLVGALLEMVNLSHARTQRLDDFSTGMRQRLGIAQALIGKPQLLIVDEPTAGLDPEERVRFHNLLAESARDGVVVILSTHIVSDVPNLCARVAVIRSGEILESRTPREAVDSLAGSVWEVNVPREQVAAIKLRHRTISAQVFDGRTRLRVLSDAMRPSDDFTPATPTLEDYYFSLTSR